MSDIYLLYLWNSSGSFHNFWELSCPQIPDLHTERVYRAQADGSDGTV